MKKRIIMALSLSLVLVLSLAGIASAADVTSDLNNPGFETGDTTGWTEDTTNNGAVSVVTSHSDFADTNNWNAQEGFYFALLEPGDADDTTVLSQSVDALIDDTISGWAFFDDRDYVGDWAEVVIIDPSAGETAVFSADDSGGDTPWTAWQYTCIEDGVHIIEARIANYSDSLFDSYLGLDLAEEGELVNRFSGGGKIIQEGEGKKKEWPKITFGGWSGYTAAMGDMVGQWEVNFHNVGNDDLDKATFTSWWVNDLSFADFADPPEVPIADPPASLANFAQVRLFGVIEYDDGSMAYGTLVINGMDNGEPGNVDEKGNNDITSDGIRIILFSGGSRIYDSYLSGDFEDDQSNPGDGVRHELDGGNLQIVDPPVEPPIIVF
ncbi:hypothetical protein ACFLT3_00800 [Chloroflexota bacterium]